VLIKCQGTHHPELLHELCDLLHEVRPNSLPPVGPNSRPPSHEARPSDGHTGARSTAAGRVGVGVQVRATCPSVRAWVCVCGQVELDVLHAEMDTDSRGTEHHALYVARRDNARTNGDERTALRGNIDALYRKHGKKDSVGEAARVSVKPLRGQEEEVMTSLAATALLGSAESPHPLSSRTRSSSPKPGRRGSPAKTSNGSFKAADPTVACCPQQADVTSSSIDVVVQ
jgi:hypothetical protein